ncbi:MAG: hypothetical protein KY393_01240 [Actinobacteria bacterium]|nr:hypothetical protein [Actinomycetota bacterium]
MGKRKQQAKADEAAEAAAVAERNELVEYKKKRGFFSKMLRGGVVMGAVAAGAKYFGDPNQGDARREKVKGQVKTAVDKQKAAIENKTSQSK